MSWQQLLDTMEAMTTHAQSDADNSAAMLEQSIVRLGEVSKNLGDAGAPTQETFIRIHASLNRLTKALPEEKNILRQKIAGLVQRGMAQKAYNDGIATNK